MNTDYPRKVKHYKYVQGFSNDLLKKFEEGGRKLREFDRETMRGLIYGYTFTEDYAKGLIPDTLSIDYWIEKDDDFFKPGRLHDLSLNEAIGRSGLIQDAIESTGDGTVDHPYCVICVAQEYEILKRLNPVMKILRQSLLPGYIDRFECEEYGIPHVIYFDIIRWFEKVKLF